MATPAHREGDSADRTTLWSIDWRVVPPLAAALALGFGTLYVLRVLIRPIAFLLLAITLAEALTPLVHWLERRLRVSRTLAVFFVYFGLFLLVALFALLIVPGLVSQGRELAAQAPDMLEQIRRRFEGWDAAVGGGLGRGLTTALGQVGTALIGLPLALLSAVVEVLIIIFLSIYWLLGAPALRRLVLSFFPKDRRENADAVFQDMGQAMGGYVRGAAINAVIVGTLAWVGLELIGVEYALVLGLITMLGEPIPYIGPILAAIPVVGIALLSSVTKGLLALGLFTLIQQIEGQLLTPNVMKSQTHVPQALVIFALIAGAAVGGLLGALVALPLAGALRVFTLQVLAPAIRRRTTAA